MTTIPDIIGRIKTALDAHFAAKGFEWKTQESQDAHSQSKPTVYALVCADRNAENWPNVCPSVTIELSESAVATERLTLGIICHCVVVNSAIIEREKTVKVGDHYEFLDIDGYTDQGVREALFADCLLLAEETMHALRAQAGVTDIRLMPPDTLEDFPYCQCQVTATVTALARFIADELL
ncbi:MAG: hypothetical protein IKY83_06320 [Proteobacteria bacterium]|nr:hypothetical protein [Pseudomonadota bacterium]